MHGVADWARRVAGAAARTGLWTPLNGTVAAAATWGCRSQRAASGLPVRSGVVGLRTLELAEEALRGIYVQACVVSVATILGD